ncbi:amino acid ABC transporter permease (plasmid) [Paracoccus versutus]|uniref:Amino acid ABC transporter membrane protein 1 (PAAT family) n=1 Tax=Paracoccus versutus TaxID=34007 RepID=A0A099F7S9_PARVE|nr:MULTISPECIES: amino acid ABC transporter permease [Paracoccus]WGR62678.1 amino acid ABC transporter permease [Paracoccus ferrooxidans]SFY43796.1 amino acid ABC transporter membrane protein 1, PAAT family (TC 3.A.1.3.-) [Paracoccus pantotrophus]KGJ06316.1 polar amino acid ABC transporter permease [Paracoccus versutus]MCJ1902467.1 amino acid ABC transporter permease [Paracoccus versutus]MDF3907084.1 amino acid ABC transporter permease [Paracoccus sp. AS002]
MLTDMQDFFRELAATSPHWNFIWLYDPVQMDRVLGGLWMTIKLSLACLVFSVVIGVVGAWAQEAKSRLLRSAVQGYVQFFRNTPPLIQLLFFYFALGQFTPSYSPDGWLEVPIISNVGWAIIALSFFAGAFNIEIFRAGIEAVPHSTREAAESLGMTRLQAYTNVVLPLTLRISLPALSANLINLVKTTNQAYAIAVPELLYQSVSIWNDFPSAQNPTMLLMMVCYLGLVGLLSLGMGQWERKLRIPGYGV